MVDREFRRGVSPVEPDGRSADETVRIGWPGARPVRLDRPTSVVPRVTASDDAGRDDAYDAGWDDAPQTWRRIALAAIAVAVFCLLVAAAILIRWVEAIS